MNYLYELSTISQPRKSTKFKKIAIVKFKTAVIIIYVMPKRTYQPKKLKRLRKVGFRKRNQDKKGRKVIKQRRLKKRKFLTPRK